jgi:hypothetical protein
VQVADDLGSPLPSSSPSKVCEDGRDGRLSFKDGMNDRLAEQLKGKLLPVDESGKGLLSVSASGRARNSPLSARGAGGAGMGNSVRGSSSELAAFSAESSPT